MAKHWVSFLSYCKLHDKLLFAILFLPLNMSSSTIKGLINNKYKKADLVYVAMFLKLNEVSTVKELVSCIKTYLHENSAILSHHADYQALYTYQSEASGNGGNKKNPKNGANKVAEDAKNDNQPSAVTRWDPVSNLSDLYGRQFNSYLKQCKQEVDWNW